MNEHFWIEFTHKAAPVLGFISLLVGLCTLVEPMAAADGNRKLRVGVALIAPLLSVLLVLSSLACHAYAASHKPTTCEKESK